MEQLGVREEDVRAGASFVHDLGAAWLDIVGLAMALEDEFGLEIPDETARTLTTVQEAVDYVQGRPGTDQQRGEPAAGGAAERAARIVADRLGIAREGVSTRVAHAIGLGVDGG